MSATVSFPPGWLAAAIEASTLPTLASETTYLPSVGEAADPHAAWQRLSRIEQGGIPRIQWEGSSYRVVDVERTETCLLFYTRRQNQGQDTGEWKIFFDDTADARDPLPLSPPQIRDFFLRDYEDEALYVRPDEITHAEPQVGASSVLENGMEIHEVAFQNGHRLRVRKEKADPSEWTTPDERRVRQVSLEALCMGLKRVPLAALTQFDEIRLSADYQASQGDAFREGGRLIAVFHPLEIGPESPLQRFFRFLYSVFHEILGHGLMYRNRFLRREMIKIVASGEAPPSDYARRSIEEWLPEGVAERWLRVAADSPELADWDFRFPHLSGLIRHLLGVLEEVVDPTNANIDLWRKTLRPLRPINDD